LAAAIKEKTGVSAELVKSSGGAFEVRKDGAVIFSKLREGRFPEHEEVLSQLG
jgi:selT/selW/selH-like putative selenoprotein